MRSVFLALALLTQILAMGVSTPRAWAQQPTEAQIETMSDVESSVPASLPDEEEEEEETYFV